MARRTRFGWLALLPALAAFAAYLPALGHDLVWDDIPFLRDFPLYRVPELWQEALRRPLVFSLNYFRPLAVLTVLGEMRIGGGNPASALFHLTNLLLHATNTGLLALLARKIGLAPRHAIAAGLLYALHPALVEPVAFVSCRFDLLMTAFLLAALLADASLPQRGVARPLAVGTGFLLAALCKEMAVALVLVLPLWQIALGRKLSAVRAPLIAVLISGAIYLVLRRAALGYVLTEQATAPSDLLLVARSLAEYLIVVLWPFTTITPLHTAALPLSARDPAVWAALGAVAAFAALLVRAWRTAARSAALALAGLLALLPVANLLPIDLGGGAFVSERFLVFPLALLAVSAVSFLAHQRAGAILLGLWLVASVIVLERTLPRWNNDLTLWTWAERLAPQSPTPPTNLARYASSKGDGEGTLAAAERALSLDSRLDSAWNLKGHALMQFGRHIEAQSAFERAVALRPESGLYRNNVAGALIEQKRYEDAERILVTEALPRDRMEPAIRTNLGILYLLTGRPLLAVPHLEEALRLVPPAEKVEIQKLIHYARSEGGGPR